SDHAAAASAATICAITECGVLVMSCQVNLSTTHPVRTSRVALAPVVGEAVMVDVPGPAVDLDGHLRVGEREVDPPRPERVAEHPPADACAAEQPADQPLRGGITPGG